MNKSVTAESVATSEANPSGLPVTTLPELEDLLPPLSPEERAELRLSVETEGVRDSLLVWRTVDARGEEIRILIDGHNRYRITEELGGDTEALPMRDIDFVDMAEAKAWIIANQLMRRNLSDGQRAYFRGSAYIATKKEQGGTGANQHKEQSGNCCRSANTSMKLAGQFGVSERTIRNDAAFTKRVDQLPPEEKAKVLTGKKKLPKVAKPEAAEPKDAKTPPPFTVDDVLSITLADPHESLLLVFRSMRRAKECVVSSPAVTPADHEALVQGCQALRVQLDGLLQSIVEMCIAEEEDETEESTETVTGGDF